MEHSMKGLPHEHWSVDWPGWRTRWCRSITSKTNRRQASGSSTRDQSPVVCARDVFVKGADEDADGRARLAAGPDDVEPVDW